MKVVKVVIGANYGDEGKGLMTDYFAGEAQKVQKNCIVVCSNGGSQRGHTVVTPDGKRHVFHHLGSGSFCGADTYLSKEYIVNPLVFQKEYKELEIDKRSFTLYGNGACPLTTPFDMFINQIVEESRGAQRHGSCGIGIWETIVRQNTMPCTLQQAKNMSDEKLVSFLRQIRDGYLPNRLYELGVHWISREWENIIGDENLIQHFVEDVRFLCSNIKLQNDDIIQKYEYIIFENGQGLLLDQNRKEGNEHTTPSNTGLQNPKEIIQRVFDKEVVDVEVCYVTRTYLTRHGAGPFDTECDKREIHPTMVDKTNVPNPHQGTLRYGWLVAEELEKRIKEDFGKQEIWKMSLAVTHCNEYVVDLNFAYEKRYESYGETRKSVKCLENFSTKYYDNI